MMSSYQKYLEACYNMGEVEPMSYDEYVEYMQREEK